MSVIDGVEVIDKLYKNTQNFYMPMFSFKYVLKEFCNATYFKFLSIKNRLWEENEAQMKVLGRAGGWEVHMPAYDGKVLGLNPATCDHF